MARWWPTFPIHFNRMVGRDDPLAALVVLAHWGGDFGQVGRERVGCWLLKKGSGEDDRAAGYEMAFLYTVMRLWTWLSI